MPNWCYNRLVIQGDAADRREFETWNRGFGPPCACAPDQLLLDLPAAVLDAPPLRHLTFDALLPVPAEVAAGGGDAESEWRLAQWGTSGNPTAETEVMDDGATLTYVFQTPWSPPQEWVIAVATRFPDLAITLEFAEPTGIFAGSMTVAGSKICEYQTTDIVEDVATLMMEWFGWDPYAWDETA